MDLISPSHSHVLRLFALLLVSLFLFLQDLFRWVTVAVIEHLQVANGVHRGEGTREYALFIAPTVPIRQISII